MLLMNEVNPQWSSDYFRDAPAGGHPHLGRGMVGHVPIVAWLLIVQGALEVAFGGFGLFFVMLTLAIPEEVLPNRQALGWLMGLVSVPGFVCGGLRILAGIYNRKFRRRTLGITALGLGLATIFTGYCAPTGIGLAIYGLIVYVNESVVAAFEMGDRGRSPSEIQAAFPPL